jgi:hypothetical protein
MKFVPNKQILVFQTGAQTEAFKWLHDQMQLGIFADVREAIEVREEITIHTVEGQVRLPHGPLHPSARCPHTGRALKLHVFRDMTALILRERSSIDHGYEALPAALSLATEINHHSLKGMPYQLRASTLPMIRTQSRPDGIYYNLINTSISDEDVSRLLSDAIVETASRILSAPAIADPRVHDYAPEGSRFPTFSIWPALPPDLDSRLHLQSICVALAHLRASVTGRRCLYIRYKRRSPDEPWIRQNPSNIVEAYWHNSHGAGPDRALVRLLRIAIETQPAFPDCYKHGHPHDDIFYLRDFAPRSMHETMMDHVTFEGLLETLPKDTADEARQLLISPLS